MMDDLPSRLADGALVVVGDGLAARQFEPFLARAANGQRASVWVSASITTFENWTSSLWSENDNDPRRLLTSAQAQALWRQVIDESAEAERLINSYRASRWAADGWQRLWHWQVDPLQLRPSEVDLEFESFLRWAKRYRSALDSNDWIDTPLAAAALAGRSELGEGPHGGVIWVDIDEPTPAQQSFYRRLDRSGWKIETRLSRALHRSAVRVRARDNSSELAAAAQWAAERLARTPEQRLALVIPDLETRRNEVRRILEDAIDPDGVLLGGARAEACFNPRGEACADMPAIGAAMTSLELLSSRGTFSTLSRWLRSPFFASETDEECARCVLELRLRVEISAQLRFLEAYSAGGLGHRIRAASPAVAQRLTQAIGVIDNAPAFATPTRWTRLWQEILVLLGWPAGIHDAATTILPAWEAALNELCLLTPIVGTITMTEALAELDRILGQSRGSGPIPLSGCTVLERPEDLGPGYDAAWVMGLTDTDWPRPARPNPLLPLRLQLEHGMPGASPRDALQRCKRATQRLLERTPELVLSWPGTVHEYPAEPSPLLAEIPEVNVETLISLPTPRLATRISGTRSRQSLEDPGPAFPAKKIPGGAGTLSVQARCPLRAFLESRLSARQLEPLSRGLNARQRGIITHRALELFLQRLPSQAELAQRDAETQTAWAEACVDRALSESFGTARAPLHVLYDLERERLLALIASLVANDLRRQEFSVAAVEERRVAEVSGFQLSCRLDRIDTLATGGVAVIDYKTGRNSRASDWFRDRLLETQLPLYAQVLDTKVTATVLAAAHTDGITYRGVWTTQDEFPGRPAKLPAGRDWAGQLATWREQLELLVAEYAAGDTRILLADATEASAALAPLTRVYEQLALSRGWIDSWTET